MPKFYLTILGVLVAFLSISQPLTVAERSNFESTANEREVNEFIRQIDQQSKILRVENIAVSAEGRNIPMMIIANPMIKSPEKLATRRPRRRGRAAAGKHRHHPVRPALGDVGHEAAHPGEAGGEPRPGPA